MLSRVWQTSKIKAQHIYFFIVGMIRPLNIWARLSKHFCCLSGIQAPVISSLTLQSWLWDPPGSALLFALDFLSVGRCGRDDSLPYLQIRCLPGSL